MSRKADDINFAVKSMSLARRVAFYMKIYWHTPQNCWLWLGQRSEGPYGRFTINNALYSAHRVAFVLWNGSISNNMCVCHTCDNSRCVNPAHLFLGTHADNMRDKMGKNRQSCVGNRGSTKGERSGTAKLSSEDVIKIRAMRKAGHTYKEIGQKFDISRVHTTRICLMRSWEHINGCKNDD